jgi:PrtD family type I secretion system ABC transporter
VLLALLFTGSINLLMLTTPLYTLQVFETVVPMGSIETLVVLSAMVAGAILALALIEVFRDRILLRAGLWLDHTLGQHILEEGLRQGRAPAELRQDIKSLGHLRTFVSGSGLGPILDAPWVPILLATLALLHPLIGAVAAGAAMLMVLAAMVLGLMTSRAQAEAARTLEKSEQWWTTVAGNAQLAGALGLTRGAAEQWELFNRSHIASSYAVGKRTSLTKAFARTIRIGAQIAVYGIGAWLVVRNELAAGALVASAILLARVLGPLEQLVTSLRSAQSALAAYRRLKSLPPDTIVPDVASPSDVSTGHVVLSDVTLYHPSRKTPAIRSVSLEISPGECFGIVGPNGAGKSTLASIIAGAVAPTTGAANIDGIPIAKWQRVDGTPAVGYLPDEPILVEGTVHENIARFREASVMSVVHSAMRVGVHETLAGLQHGYDTPVGADGSGLSLRERRAVAFARAAHGSPRLVVLDEPEIGLDGQSMRALTRVVQNLKSEGVGVVIATQDPRLLSLTDRVALLSGGSVQAVCPARELAHRMEAAREPAQRGVHREDAA